MLKNSSLWNNNTMSDDAKISSSQAREHMAAVLLKKQELTNGAIALSLIDSAKSTSTLAIEKDFQDPSTVTAEQLQSPVDIRI
jgi:hypothetical protein